MLLVSPFHGGSHQAWAEGLIRHSSADFEILSLPGRFWKWRMHGGGVTLARRFNKSGFNPDLILATDMLDLSIFLAHTRKRTAGTPAILYCHENQLSYPMPSSPAGNRTPELVEQTDQHYPFINISSMLAADRILFNSSFHQNELLESLPGYLGQFPEFRLDEAVLEIKRKSSVIYPGISTGEASSGPNPALDKYPLILWNQRMEHDKNPGEFFSALVELKNRGLHFRLAVCGEQFSRHPDGVDAYLETLKKELIHLGFAERKTYQDLLLEADIVLSTALHEFFGISILEAVLNQTFPILPARLSYPELLPPEFHDSCLYKNRAEMLSLLANALEKRDDSAKKAETIRETIGDRFSWPHLARQYDAFFQDTLAKPRHPGAPSAGTS